MDDFKVALIAFIQLVIIAAGMLIKEWIDRKRAEALAKKLADENAVKAAAVQDLSDKVEVIHSATNSMKDALILSTEKEALLRGAAAERDRNEPRSRHG